MIGEHRRLGPLELRLINISAQGFMILGHLALDRGERVELQLPHVGRLDAHLVWRHEGRAGFQFERIIRDNDFRALLDAMVQPKAGG